MATERQKDGIEIPLIQKLLSDVEKHIDPEVWPEVRRALHREWTERFDVPVQNGDIVLKPFFEALVNRVRALERFVQAPADWGEGPRGRISTLK